MSDISMPNGIGVAVGVYFTLWIGGIALVIAFVAAASIHIWLPVELRDHLPFRVATLFLAPMTCFGCAGLYFLLASSGGDRTLRMFDDWCFDCPIVALALSATVTISVQVFQTLRRAKQSSVSNVVSAAMGGAFLVVFISIVGKTVAHAMDADFGVSLPMLAAGLSSVAVFTIAAAGALAVRLGRAAD